MKISCHASPGQRGTPTTDSPIVVSMAITLLIADYVGVLSLRPLICNVYLIAPSTTE